MWLGLMAGMWALGSSTAEAQVLLDYETDTFCQNQSALSLHGDARFVGTGPCSLRLADAVSDEVGSSWSVGATFEVSATTRIESRFSLAFVGGTSDSASGLTSALRSVSSANLGGDRYEMGYGGIGSSIAVEFDTYLSSSASDPDDNHVGVNANGSMTSVVTSSALPGDLDNGAPYYVWLVYDQAIGVFDVYMSATQVQPASPLLSWSVTLPEMTQLTFGFTAATGGSNYSNHDILSWHLYADNDTDLDGVYDLYDVCAGFDDSIDLDGDLVPDGCDPCPMDNPDDSDSDGVCESVDICPGGDDNVDGDGDGTPDFCDPCPLDVLDDSDADGVCDSDDVCPGFDDTVNTDGDALPDDCDRCPLDVLDDSDGDGVCDSDDICPGFSDLVDGDGDSTPDGCDPCPKDPLDDSDGDGVCDGVDVCPGVDDNLDTDGDTTPDCLDPCPLDALDDSDGDGVCDSDDVCPGQDDRPDGDGDGSPTCADCDDTDPSIYPGAAGEVPADGVDTDCDGLELCFEDLDEDGFGSDVELAVSSLDCLGVDGVTDNNDDCDDEDPTVYPGAEDVPGNGIDEDCDGFDGSVDGGTGLSGLDGGRLPPGTGTNGVEGQPLPVGCGCDTDLGSGAAPWWIVLTLGWMTRTRQRRGFSRPVTSNDRTAGGH